MLTGGREKFSPVLRWAGGGGGGEGQFHTHNFLILKAPLPIINDRFIRRADVEFHELFSDLDKSTCNGLISIQLVTYTY